MNTRILIVLVLAGMLCSPMSSMAQQPSVLTTAVPFLSINPDARSAGIGNIGVASSPDGSSMFNNPSKLAFVDNDYGVSFSYSPWLRNLQVNDIYLASMSGYYKIDDRQTIGTSLRYFSLGNITFTNLFGSEIGDFRPNEFAVDGHYARKLSEYFSAGISLRFIYSNLASGFEVSGQTIKPGTAASGDLSLFFSKPVEVGNMDSRINIGTNISNIGSKITYTDNAVKDFIPTNLGIGAGWELDIDDNNEINIYGELNKLLVPTPDTIDADNNAVLDYREKSPIGGIFSSFADAPGGAKEELQEMMFGVGMEYWYRKTFAARLGYHHENAFKGNRKFMTAGVSLKYTVFALDFSYLIPTSTERNPLDNTMRFTLSFDFNKGGSASSGAAKEAF